MHVLCPRYLQVKQRSDQKQGGKGGDIIFPIISQWGLSVAMETRVLIQSAPKPYAAFQMSPLYISHSAVYILFWSSEISENILRNQK